LISRNGGKIFASSGRLRDSTAFDGLRPEKLAEVRRL
jgi:hypothetical protein